MSDVKDILGFKTPPKSSSKRQLDSILTPKKKKTTPIKKPDGVSREVFLLTEGGKMGTPDTADAPAEVSTPTFKEKRKIAIEDEPIRWNFLPFVNPARTDGLLLHHWIKTPNDPKEEYPFYKFNKKLKIMEYTSEQYEIHFNNDPNWTKEQTDHLFDLCKRFDLRFIVIADQFLLGSKTVEDVKERYYSIEKKLLELNYSEEELQNHPLYKFKYNKESEEERKKQMEKLFNRTKAQILEEEHLLKELHRIENTHKKNLKASKRVISSLEGELEDNPKKKLKQAKIVDEGFPEPFLPSPPLPSLPSPPPSVMPPPPPMIPPAELPEEHHEEEKGIKVMRVRKEPTSGPWPRSSKILGALPVSLKLNKRIDEDLFKLGVSLRPMASAQVEEAFNLLRNDIRGLVELENHIKKKEYELQLLKDQKEALKSQGTVPLLPIIQSIDSLKQKNVTPKAKRKNRE